MTFDLTKAVSPVTLHGLRGLAQVKNPLKTPMKYPWFWRQHLSAFRLSCWRTWKKVAKKMNTAPATCCSGGAGGKGGFFGGNGGN